MWQWWSTLDTTWRELVVSHLDLDGCFSEADLSYLPAIEELDCRGVALRDLTPLTRFSGLRGLNLSETPLTDLAALQHTPDLQQLDLSFGQGYDLQQLHGLHQLSVLDLSYPLQRHLHPEALAGLTSLRELYCNACGLDSLLFACQLPQLEVLAVPFNPLDSREIELFQAVNPICRLLF
ncbi:MAG: hypothetical protein OHK0039_04820 [Bacteroidia bacterium]